MCMKLFFISFFINNFNCINPNNFLKTLEPVIRLKFRFSPFFASLLTNASSRAFSKRHKCKRIASFYIFWCEPFGIKFVGVRKIFRVVQNRIKSDTNSCFFWDYQRSSGNFVVFCAFSGSVWKRWIMSQSFVHNLEYIINGLSNVGSVCFLT